MESGVACASIKTKTGEFRQGVIQGLPIFMGYVPAAMAFGVLGTTRNGNLTLCHVYSTSGTYTEKIRKGCHGCRPQCNDQLGLNCRISGVRRMVYRFSDCTGFGLWRAGV